MTIRDLAILARLPNLPTVWSNVAAGYLLAIALGKQALRGTTVEPGFSAATMAWLLGSATFLYLCGTFLNDAIDADFDARHRGERPIPSGRASRDAVLNLGMIFGIAGLACAIPAGKHALVVATVLLACVLSYTWWHKRTVIASLFMALCRACLPVLGAAAVITRWGGEWHQPAWWVIAAGGLLFCYTLGISLLARGESTGGSSEWLKASGLVALSLPFFAPVAVLMWLLCSYGFSGWQAGAVAGTTGCLGLGWVWFSSAAAVHSVATMVSRALAGLALVDIIILIPVWLAQPAILLLPFAAFTLALLCRRVVPST